MVDGRPPSKALGLLSLSLFALAAIAFVVPLTLFVLASSDKGIAIGAGPTEIRAVESSRSAIPA